MKKLFYPAIFQTEDEGAYFISFPNLPECLTQGENLEDGYEMATDALGVVLAYYDDNKIPFPTPSAPNELSVDKNQFVVVIEFDLIEYRKKHDDKAVKKTLTIPSWLNEKALEKDVNFSQLLQEALINKLNI